MACSECNPGCLYRRGRKCYRDAFRPEPAPARSRAAPATSVDADREDRTPDYAATGEDEG